MPETLGRRLLWVSRIVAPERMVAVRAWLAGRVGMASSEVNATSLGYFWAGVLLTVMVTKAELALLPALSWAWADRMWLALVRVVVSRGTEMVPAEVEENTEPSTSKVRDLRPEVTWPETVGSEATAEKVMIPEAVPEEGVVMETVGAVVSGLD